MTKLELENLVKEKEEEIASLKARVEELENSNHDVLSLEDRIKNLETEKQYLCEAIDAKDKEIWELKQNLENKTKEAKTLAEDFANKKLESVQKNFENTQKNYQEVIKKQEEQIKKLATHINNLINNHGSLLKALQGTLDNAIALNDYVYNDIFRKENN